MEMGQGMQGREGQTQAGDTDRMHQWWDGRQLVGWMEWNLQRDMTPKDAVGDVGVGMHVTLWRAWRHEPGTQGTAITRQVTHQGKKRAMGRDQSECGHREDLGGRNGPKCRGQGRLMKMPVWQEPQRTRWCGYHQPTQRLSQQDCG